MPVIQKSVEQLGFKFSDIKIVLGNHAPGDHQDGDALVKQLTGAQVMVMTEDVPALQAMKPGGKAHPIDRILHDGDRVTLGGTTLVAHLTPGDTRGGTTWTMKAEDAGTTYDVMFGCSLRAPEKLTPQNVDEFNRSFARVPALPCDMQLGDHGPSTTCRRNTPSSGAAVRTPSSILAAASSRRRLQRPCSARSSPNKTGGSRERRRSLRVLRDVRSARTN